MKKTKIFLLLIAMLAAIAFTACGGGGGGGGDGAPSGGGGGGPTLVSIAVTPNNQSIATGNTQQFTATGTYSDGSAQDITSSATWSSSDTTVAGISNTGLTTAGTITAGSTTITASSGGISGNTILKVIINLPETGQTTSYVTGDDGALQKGVAWPSPRFTVDGTGLCVTDNLTGLMWVRTPDSDLRTWQEALDYANVLSICGYSDWRFPNRKELRSLINYGQSNSATWLNLPAQGFSNVQAYGYWSSSTYAGSTTFAWGVDMGYGSVFGGSKTTTYYVWPVRAGQ